MSYTIVPPAAHATSPCLRPGPAGSRHLPAGPSPTPRPRRASHALLPPRYLNPLPSAALSSGPQRSALPCTANPGPQLAASYGSLWQPAHPASVRRTAVLAPCGAVRRGDRRPVPFLQPIAATSAQAQDTDADGDLNEADEGEDELSYDPAVALDELLYRPGEEVPYYLGPLEVRETPGAGVGLFLTSDVAAGTALLACYPLALMRDTQREGGGGDGSVPSPAGMVESLSTEEMSPLAAAWLLNLYGSGGGDTVASSRRRLVQLRQLLRQPFGPDAAAPSDGDGGDVSGVGTSATAVRCPLPREALRRLLSYNAYGEARPDPVVSHLRLLPDEPFGGCVGLWPVFSLINHSCAPSGSYGLVGDVMVVRAARDMQAGEQLTISYLGPRTMTPAPLRDSFLTPHYGFSCTCRRCTLETPEEAAGDSGEQQQGKQQGKQLPLHISPQLAAYMQALYGTCTRTAVPHLADLLTGRRWWGAAAGGGGAEAGIGGMEAAAAGAVGDTTAATATSDEPVSDLMDELTTLYDHLTECLQQLEGAAAVVGMEEGQQEEVGGGGEGGGGDQTSMGLGAGTGMAVGVGGENEASGGEGEGDGSGLPREEALWLQGSVFVLLELLTVVAGVRGLLRKMAGTTTAAMAAAAGAEDEVEVVVEAEAGGASVLTAAAAMQSLTARRWPLTELSLEDLRAYVRHLERQAAVAVAVAPGSDLAVASAVRVLYGIRALVQKGLGADGDDDGPQEGVRMAELECYDTVCAKYGILEYDVYEQVLELCSKLYGAAEVRMTVLTGGGMVAVGAGRSGGSGGGEGISGGGEGVAAGGAGGALVGREAGAVEAGVVG